MFVYRSPSHLLLSILGWGETTQELYLKSSGVPLPVQLNRDCLVQLNHGCLTLDSF